MMGFRQGHWWILAFSLSMTLLGCGGQDSDDTSDTTGAGIAPATGPIVINEVVAKAADDGADWVELYNRGDIEVSLDGYALQDDKDDNLFLLPADLTILPGDFLVIEGKSSANEVLFPFGLGSDEAVRLLGDDGTIIDMLDWEDGEAPKGQSYGRYPDGGSDIGTLEFTTYGAANAPLGSGETPASVEEE